jgi:hypothetical protein
MKESLEKILTAQVFTVAMFACIWFLSKDPFHLEACSDRVVQLPPTFTCHSAGDDKFTCTVKK